MKRKLPPWKLRRHNQQRIGCGVPWTDLAVLFAMPREASQERAGEAQCNPATDGSPDTDRAQGGAR